MITQFLVCRQVRRVFPSAVVTTRSRSKKKTYLKCVEQLFVIIAEMKIKKGVF